MRKGLFLFLFTVVSSTAWGQGMVEGYEDFIGPAKAGDARAQYYVGFFLERGRGVAKDEQQAIAWFRKAAEQGHVKAQNNLANRYFLGKGVKKDYKQAFYWWNEAAKDDESEEALYMLAKCYENGLGVQKDVLQALLFYQRALDTEELEEEEEEIAQNKIMELKGMLNSGETSKSQQTQKLTVKSMTAAPMDISASKYERKDNNEIACALVKVLLAVPGVQFEGNVLYAEFRTSEYWVYLSEGTRELRIKCPGYVSQHVVFKDYGIKDVKSKATYNLTLIAPNSSVQKFTIRYSPMNAIVLIDSKPYSGKNGVVTATLPTGQHDYVVTADGYNPHDGSVKLNASSPSTVTVNLERINE